LEEKKAELHKERLRIVEKDLVTQWKATVSNVDEEYHSETLRLSNELWSESRRLAPRTTCLGSDMLGNKYWVFLSRKTKEREFGGWVVIQTPGDKTPTGDLVPAKDVPVEPPTSDEVENEEQYSDLKSWYYVEKAEDIRQLAKWTMYLAAKAAADFEYRKAKTAGIAKGSPNNSGQTSAAVNSPMKMKKRNGRGRKVVEFAGLVDTRALCDELIHAAQWIEER
jgi:hypothetical protein